MASIKQLRGDLTTSGDQPSTNLETYFKVRLVFSYWSTYPVWFPLEWFWPTLLCSVTRTALWTRPRTYVSVWKSWERRSASGLARRSALSLWDSVDRYSLVLFGWRTTTVHCHIINLNMTHMHVTCLSEVQPWRKALLQSHGGNVEIGTCSVFHKHLHRYWQEISTNSSPDCN